MSGKLKWLVLLLGAFVCFRSAAGADSVEPSVAEQMAALKGRESKVRAVHERVAASVVALGSDEGKPGWGSGVIVNAEGLILTAGHVTEATGTDVNVYLADGRRVRGKTLGAYMDRDASMVQLLPDHKESFPYVDVAEANTAEEGDWVVAMGHPGGYDPKRPAPLRLGRILQKQSENLLVTDCTLAGGDSGGPLFDLDGRLIGIHSSISSSLSHNMHVAIGVFHENWDRIRGGEHWGKLEQLFDEPLPGYESPIDRERNQAVLGAELSTRGRGGVLVTSVKAGFPAADAGLKRGDRIKTFNDEVVDDYASFFELLSKAQPGDLVALTVERRGEDLKIEVTMGDRSKLLPNR